MIRDSNSPFDNIETALQAIAAGGLIIVTDDEDRENEGDLIMAAARATPETINMMILHGRGLICVSAHGHHLKQLGINPMVPENHESNQTDFAVSVDAAEGITTGISAYDRARTIRLLAGSETRPCDLVSPGHVFPLRAKPGGVLQRAGHTEASVDLTALAGLPPVGVLCEILNEDGSLARLPDLIAFKKRFGLPMISIADLIDYRRRRERLVERVHSRPFESEFGNFELHVFRNTIDGSYHLAFTMGELGEEPILVRVQSENVLSDLFRGSDWGNFRALSESFRAVAAEGRGVVIYIRQFDGGLDAVLHPGECKPMVAIDRRSGNLRDHGIGAQILNALGLRRIRLLSTHQMHVVALEGYNLEVVEQVRIKGF